MNYFEARNVKSDFYDNYIIPLYMKKLLPKQKEVYILDFGCGFGQTLLALKKDGYNNIVGVDIEKSAIEFCKSKGLNVKDCSNLDGFIKSNQNQFDLVIMSHALEHFPKNEIIPTLKKIKSIMKKDGEILVMVPNAQSNTNCYWAYEDFTLQHYLHQEVCIMYLKWQVLVVLNLSILIVPKGYLFLKKS